MHVQQRGGAAPERPETLAARDPDNMHPRGPGAVLVTGEPRSPSFPLCSRQSRDRRRVPQAQDAIVFHFERLKKTGALEHKRLESIRYQLSQFVFDEITHLLSLSELSKVRDDLAQKVFSRKLDVYSAGMALFHSIPEQGATHEHPQT